ncbi:MAG: FAD-binding protein [Spirochaetaceae bacterium]|nr:FAD-binding protein [Spirochaetaceae bacterium]
MSYIEVDKNMCNGCAECVAICNYEAISVINEIAVIDRNKCTLCRACIKGCTQSAISILKLHNKADLSNYKGIWVIVEYFDDQLKNTGFQLISKANKLAEISGDKVTAVLIGNSKAENKKLQKTFSDYGVSSVRHITHEGFTRFIPEDAVDVISDQIMEDKPKIVLFLGTIFGRTIAPQIAVRVKTGLTADCTELEIDNKNNLLQIRPTFGGKILATIETPHSCPQMASVRPNVFVEEKMPIPVENVKIERIEVRGKLSFSAKALKEVIRIELGEGSLETPLDEAKVIFCAGLGVGSKEGFEKVEKFAQKCGATIAATRAVVDEGWTDFSKQIGQTGVTVIPELYVAFGVSGAIHHNIGIRNSRKIVAINNDPRASIFKIADYCIVADLFEVLDKMELQGTRQTI